MIVCAKRGSGCLFGIEFKRVELYCSSFLLQTCRRNYAARSKPSIALARGSVCLPRGARGE